ncbi:Hypothetical protein Trvi_ORF126 [Trabala vishnou gigantina nucleopolyhedrovirus]|uniref:Hypothetical protein n=1 Tax=Trabala vishnou gigantina nucleopolyhedrovirus TaxID=2863583 RepID=UPI002481BFB6|nr:Hypothetical protein QKU87_gp126 [Trabala vishnou gigantina nucleopolyhedrovirus]QYC92756.1 Hypothetical protein Trvi_ORF126 [Trabala vishnou gigantina nucleopolyhedrovirus]
MSNYNVCNVDDENNNNNNNNNVSHVIDEKENNLNVGYLDYYNSLKYIVNFVKGYVDNKNNYEYKDYKIFANTVVKLIGNLIDDYMSDDFKLWSGAEKTAKINDFDILTEINKKIEFDLQHDQQTDTDVYKNLINILQNTLLKLS